MQVGTDITTTTADARSLDCLHGQLGALVELAPARSDSHPSWADESDYVDRHDACAAYFQDSCVHDVIQNGLKEKSMRTLALVAWIDQWGHGRETSKFVRLQNCLSTRCPAIR